MGAVIDFVGDVFDAVGDVVEAVGDFVEDVVEAVGDVVNYVVENPEIIVIAVAAPYAVSAVGGAIGASQAAITLATQPVTAAAISASQGGDLEDIGKAALGSFAGAQIGGAVASKVGSAIGAQGAATPIQTALANAAGGAAGGAAGAVAVGADVGGSAIQGALGSAGASLARSGALSQFDIDETGKIAEAIADVGEAAGRTAGGANLGEELLQAGLSTVTREGRAATRELLSPTDADIQQEIKKAAGVQDQTVARNEPPNIDDLIQKSVRDPASKVEVAQAAGAMPVSALSAAVETTLMRNLVTELPASTLDKIVANSSPLNRVLAATEQASGTTLERIIASAEGRAQLLKEIVASTPEMAKKYANRATVESLMDAGLTNAARALVGVGALALPSNVLQQTNEDQLMAEKIQEMLRTQQPAAETGGEFVREGEVVGSKPVTVTGERPDTIIEVGRNVRPGVTPTTRPSTQPSVTPVTSPDTGTAPDTGVAPDTGAATAPGTSTQTATQTQPSTQTQTQTQTQTATSRPGGGGPRTRVGGPTGGGRTGGGTTGGGTTTDVTNLTGTDLLRIEEGGDDLTKIDDGTDEILTEKPIDLTTLSDQELFDYLNQEFPLTTPDTETAFEPLDVRPARVGRAAPKSISPRVVGTSPVAAIIGEKEPVFGGEPDPQQDVWNVRSLRLRKALGL
jgi:hypothetical protein